MPPECIVYWLMADRRSASTYLEHQRVCQVSQLWSCATKDTALLLSLCKQSCISRLNSVLLRPPNFHRHRSDWLPPNQHRHCGVLQCSRQSFWVLFTENCPSRPQSSQSSKCHVIWSCVNARESSQRHCPPSPARPLPHSSGTAGTV